MHFLAIVFDDRPPEWKLIQLAAYLPAAVIFISWVLIRRKRSLAIASWIVAVVAAYLILAPFQRHAQYLTAMRIPYPGSVVCAYWFSALFPFFMITVFYLTSKKEPIQPSQPMLLTRHG